MSSEYLKITMKTLWRTFVDGTNMYVVTCGMVPGTPLQYASFLHSPIMEFRERRYADTEGEAFINHVALVAKAGERVNERRIRQELA